MSVPDGEDVVAGDQGRIRVARYARQDLACGRFQAAEPVILLLFMRFVVEAGSLPTSSFEGSREVILGPCLP